MGTPLQVDGPRSRLAAASTSAILARLGASLARMRSADAAKVDRTSVRGRKLQTASKRSIPRRFWRRCRGMFRLESALMPMKQEPGRKRRTATGVAILAAIYVCGFRGPTDLASYPPADSSPYRLPFETGTSRWCVQGNRSTFSHRGNHTYSYDFLMPVGTPIVASRNGTVVEVSVARKGIGNFPGNRIVIEHSDGTRCFYVHLEEEGSWLEVGDEVFQGQVIGRSGTTGRSLYPHLHIHVESNGEGIPFTFCDLGRHAGIPRVGFRYKSPPTRAE